MILTQEQIKVLEEQLEDPWTYISAAQSTQKIGYVLKAIYDQITEDGVDWQYELNKKGKILQDLYEEIYAANREDLE